MEQTIETSIPNLMRKFKCVANEQILFVDYNTFPDSPTFINENIDDFIAQKFNIIIFISQSTNDKLLDKLSKHQIISIIRTKHNTDRAINQCMIMVLTLIPQFINSSNTLHLSGSDHFIEAISRFNEIATDYKFKTFLNLNSFISKPKENVNCNNDYFTKFLMVVTQLFNETKPYLLSYVGLQLQARGMGTQKGFLKPYIQNIMSLQLGEKVGELGTTAIIFDHMKIKQYLENYDQPQIEKEPTQLIVSAGHDHDFISFLEFIVESFETKEEYLLSFVRIQFKNNGGKKGQFGEYTSQIYSLNLAERIRELGHASIIFDTTAIAKYLEKYID